MEIQEFDVDEVILIFPNQLFEENPSFQYCKNVYLIEEYLFFNQYNFHKSKLVFHRATMKFYHNYLKEKGINVTYINAKDELSDIRKLIPFLAKNGTTQFHYCKVIDNWLNNRIQAVSARHKIKINEYESPLFLNTTEINSAFFATKKRYFQTDFYIHQRKKHNILLENNDKPIGGKWSFDAENRAKYPKNKIAPKINFDAESNFVIEAKSYIEENFRNNYGLISSPFPYPVTFDDTRNWLQQFLDNRIEKFGVYEDAIVAEEKYLHHSILTPMLNVGLITPKEIIEKTIAYSSEINIPLNSLEGFIRQIIGWREFIRAMYEEIGTKERTLNFWGFNRKIPASFWSGTTGIVPVDNVIKKVLETGYCHHIERLMVLGNFMLLCEFDPDEVYKWFMELFIDAYDWVMVPNVYGMSQFADGGMFATKPYISGSNYIMKMSNFEKGDWQPIWDGLFWRFMDKHRFFFNSNPRLGMLVTMFDRMDESKKLNHLNNAEEFLESLSA